MNEFNWFDYIRQNIWLGIIFASILSSLANIFANYIKKVDAIPDTKVSIFFSVLFGLAVTKLDLDWSLLSSYQDTILRLGATIFMSWLVAKIRGVEVVNFFIDKVVDGAKNFNIGKKDGQ